MDDCRPLSTPMEAGLKLRRDMVPRSVTDVALMSDVPYRSAVGSIVYAMVANRPDIAAAVAAVSGNTGKL